MSDSSLQATALRLITKKGRPVQILRRVTTTPLDPTKPWQAPATQSLTTSTYGVWIDPLKSTQDYQFSDKIEPHSSLLRSGWDVMVPASGLSFTPMQGDYVVDSDGKEYKIVTISPMKPGLTGFFFTLQVQV